MYNSTEGCIVFLRDKISGWPIYLQGRYFGWYLPFFLNRHQMINFSVWLMCLREDFYFDVAGNGISKIHYWSVHFQCIKTQNNRCPPLYENVSVSELGSHTLNSNEFWTLFRPLILEGVASYSSFLWFSMHLIKVYQNISLVFTPRGLTIPT